jgi:hypothetical protein
VEKPKGKKPLGRPRGGWEDSIQVILEKEDEVVLTGRIWLMIATNGKLL